MAWSLGCHMRADKVQALLDEQAAEYPPEVRRFYSRETAAAIIHAALWGYGVREGSTAGAYAGLNLLEGALKLKNWTWEQEEADALHRFRNRNAPSSRIRENMIAEYGPYVESQS